jgi:hypothetical protein
VTTGDQQAKLNAKVTAQDVLTDQPSGQVRIEQVPVAMLDQLGGQGGKLLRILGDRIDTVTLRASRPDKANMNLLALGAEVRSPLTNADINGRYDSASRGFTLAAGSFLELEVTPAAFTELLATAAQQGLTLDIPGRVRVEFEEFRTVLRDSPPEATPEAPPEVAPETAPVAGTPEARSTLI